MFDPRESWQCWIFLCPHVPQDQASLVCLETGESNLVRDVTNDDGDTATIVISGERLVWYCLKHYLMKEGMNIFNNNYQK